ncbi:tRNA-splicing endonuclease subunit Sen34-like isoform X2 [Saccoglossus kowalevskii]|uniref:tRNA-splicing endonuclease subunit Sen34-like n=1 Tax=Saccoglossus kowalevskii TaxID=10224 RepID=A0ABM0M8A0_SACKO|nr:PREDICTED: tRNA-splicing endonuclease subunit Sen34-like [Saccoglossus kowalevskii]
MAESAKMEDDVSNSKESEPPILINLTNGKIFIWDAEDVMKVREVHHIMGTLVGTLSRSPRQNIQHGLPLQLLPEEAALLIEYNVAKLVKLKPLKVSAAMVEDFKKHRQQSFEEQKVIMKQGKETIEQEMAEVIEAGRAAKRRKKGAGKRWHRNQQVCKTR